MTSPDVLMAIFKELNAARLLHPVWPENRIEQSAIVAEEAGEALKEALNLRPSDPHSVGASTAEIEAMKAKWQKELVQTAAMAIRALEGY